MPKKIKPTDWRCVICGVDCSFGVSGVIKKQLYCLKHYKLHRKPLPDAPQSTHGRLSGILVV